mgnify:CR=1 FL=1
MIKSFFDSKNIVYKEDVSLRNYNTYRVNTICKYLVFPKNIDELKQTKENMDILKKKLYIALKFILTL